MTEHAQIVDGNVLSGPLAEVLRTDASTLRIRCASCGTTAVLAEAVVELDEQCAIVRCRTCTHTLLTAMWGAASLTLTIGGTDLTFPRA